MKYYFVQNSFQDEIKNNVMNKLFPKLEQFDKQPLFEMYIDIVDIIAIKFNFDLSKKEIYEQQLRQNDYRDLKGILYLLLPFINDDDGSKKNNLNNFDEMYKKKYEQVDINEIEPKYIYTNLQYGRCKRDKKITEINFNMDHIKHNYYLLKDTIQQISNKLYINWLNVRPIPRLSKKELNEYKFISETLNVIKNNKLSEWDTVLDNEDGRYYQGLTINDIYDTLSNDLYHSIKKIRWLIYDLRINEKDAKTYIFILPTIIDLEQASNDLGYNQLSEIEKNNFDKHWKEVINALENNLIFNEIYPQSLEKLLADILYFFESSYNLKLAMDDGYIKSNIKLDEDDDEDDENKKREIDRNNLLITLNSLPAIHLYEFLRKQLNILKKTYYGKVIFNYTNGEYQIKDNISEISFYQENITIKNIYNFAKSLTHNFKDETMRKGQEYAKYWKMLNYEDRKIILSRLNSNSENQVLSWFNLGRYIKRTYGYVRKQFVKKNQDIFMFIKENLAFIIADVMITKGVLSQFIPELGVTDINNLPKNFEEKKKFIQTFLKTRILENPATKQNWKDSYYFLTGEKYSELHINKCKNNTKISINYLNTIEEETWFTFYAMDWISQISFFHRYLNNRVMFVTGGTGVGKSTQVPKLLLYALKAIDYKNLGKIICSQPRVPPTRGNSEIIASQMGVNIDDLNNNYYIQYQTKEDKHILNNQEMNLKIVTDRILLNDLMNNIISKSRKYNDKSKEYEYFSDNIYDIIIVDEAHEHNINMDLILTLMKYISYYNNDLKFVIISATMDEDEPIYRRFYRDINDNRKYPFNFLLDKYKLDRINVDRRIHISEPGGGTRFEIKECYKSDTECKIQDKSPEDIIINITKTSDSGYILLFQPGEGEISESIDYLNKNLPKNVIALPYFSKMSEEKRKFIEKIDDTLLYNLVIPRNLPFDSTGSIPLDQQVPKGTYNRAVIVATNIAEASITISSLRYVVETGIQKTMEYFYDTRQSELITGNISESSRLQRKGRVGRVAPGFVYYVYNRGTMEKNKRKYQISVSNLTEDIFSLLKNSPNELALFDKTNDPNSINANYKYENVANIYNQKLFNFIVEQYFDKKNFIKYYGNENHHDYYNNKIPHLYYQTGFSNTTIEDNYGDFYIIHPEELCIKRNINGTIVGINNNKTCDIVLDKNKILSKKLTSFENILMEKIFLYENKNELIKTEFGIKFFDLKRALELEDISDINFLISCLYARSYGIGEDLIKLIPLYKLLSGSISNLIYGEQTQKGYRTKIETFQNIYGNCESDSCALLIIANKIIKFHDEKIINFKGKVNDNFKIDLIKYKQEYINSTKNKNECLIVNKKDKNEMNVLKKLKELDDQKKLVHSNNLETQEIKEFLKKNIHLDILNISLENKYEFIKKWAKDNLLNISIINQYIKNYHRFNNSWIKIEHNLLDSEPDEKQLDINLKWFDERLKKLSTIKDNCSNITLSLLHGFGYNISKNIIKTPLYMDVANPKPESIYIIKNIAKKSKIKDSLINKKCIGNYLLYLNKTDFGISILHNVTPKIIQNVVPYIYNPLIFKKQNDENKKIVMYISSLFDIKNKKTQLVSEKIIYNYLNTLEEIKLDFSNNYNDMIWETFRKLDLNEYFQNYLNSLESGQFKYQSGGNKNYQNYNKYKESTNVFTNYLLHKILKKYFNKYKT
ncbi:DEAD/DEAH box RNA helicase [uncultured virus]|nr:DEAD/DEAH box RNA helicase [uncultured virus]